MRKTRKIVCESCGKQKGRAVRVPKPLSEAFGLYQRVFCKLKCRKLKKVAEPLF